MVRFITFEGGDGTGKTTQLRVVESHLRELNRSRVLTREPGGTALGKMLRKVLLEAGDEEIAESSELFLYLADRAQHVRQVIAPALLAGKIVLCDRFSDSTLAYQGYGRGMDLDWLRRLNDTATQGLRPDLSFLFDCPVEIGLARAVQRGTQSQDGRPPRGSIRTREARISSRRFAVALWNWRAPNRNDSVSSMPLVPSRR